MAVDAAPRQKLAVGRARERVVLAASDLDDFLTVQRVNQLRLQDESAVGANLGLDSELGVVIKAPADNVALGVEDEAVVRSAAELGGLGAAGQTADAAGVECRSVITLEKTASELGLLASAPGVDLVLLVQSEDVV